MPTIYLLAPRIWHVTVEITSDTGDDRQRTFEFSNDDEAYRFIIACSERRLRTSVTHHTDATASHAILWLDRVLNQGA